MSGAFDSVVAVCPEWCEGEHPAVEEGWCPAVIHDGLAQEVELQDHVDASGFEGRFTCSVQWHQHFDDTPATVTPPFLRTELPTWPLTPAQARMVAAALLNVADELDRVTGRG